MQNFLATLQQTFNAPETGTYVIQIQANNLVSGNTYQIGIELLTPGNPWVTTSFPGGLNGNWFSDFDGSFQWSISGSASITTFNRTFAVQSTFVRSDPEIEYKVITTEAGRWHTFFFKNVTASNMQATFTNCPSSPTGFATESEALAASPVYNTFCNGNHK